MARALYTHHQCPRACRLHTVYFHTLRKTFASTTPVGKQALLLSSASDFLLYSGARIVTNAAAAHEEEAHQTREHDTRHGPHVHGHATHAALENPKHRHVRSYDEATGSHYGDLDVPAARSAPLNIRSGNPGGTSLVMMAAPFAGGARLITQLEVSLRYNVGYGAGGGTGASVSLEFQPDAQCPGDNTTVLWRSPQLFLPSYEANHTNYGALPIRLAGLSIAVPPQSAFIFRFENGDHNLQVLLPLYITLGWQ